MADPKKRLSLNVDGEFFVDATCINCDTCRQLAPQVFDEDEGEDFSFVASQPRTKTETRDALHALLSCPTGSIGTMHANEAKEALQDFPLPIEDEVYYCGFNSPKSYGGNSYFIQHPDGNWLVDSPKFLPSLVKKLHAMGGIRYIFLTHQDDVADAAQYAQEFQAQRIIHKTELRAQPGAEVVIEGEAPVALHPDFLIIPTPGHTRGHCVLLYRNRFLFTGDHLSWSRERGGLGSSSAYSWYSWTEQKKSLAKLQEYPFEWVLPGHGQRMYLPGEGMHQSLASFLKAV